MKGIEQQNTPLIPSIGYEAAEPLWKRVPTKDKNGELLADFMVLIPKLNKQNKYTIGTVIDKLLIVLAQYQEVVVFADLNMKINILWVSLRPVVGMCTEIPAAIIQAVPEAKLIGERQH